MSKDLIRDGVNPGQHLLRLAWLSTILLAIVAALGLAASEDFLPFVVVVSSSMFLLGSFLLLVGLLYGLRRSRAEIVTVAGLFLLQGSAPSMVRRVFAWSIAFQFAIAFSAAAVEPYTEIAFVILAPMLPLGSAALWSAQHGFFAQRGSGPA